MTGRQLLFAQVIVLVVLFGIVIFGMSHDYLWGVAWYSATAHFLGGLWAALFFTWGQGALRLSRSVAYVVVATFVLGVCWEIFEFSIGATHFPVDTVDTIADLIMDVIGGTMGALIMKYLWPRK